eukprot:c24071_g1_i1 orf=117-560(+)
MALGRFLDRAMVGPILLLNFILYVIVLAIAGWGIDATIEATLINSNEASSNFIIFTLIAGVVGLASILGGLHLVRNWRAETNVSANASSALIAWFLLLLAFGLACKEIQMGHTNTNLKFMEGFVIILTVTQGAYVILLHGHHLSSPL